VSFSLLSLVLALLTVGQLICISYPTEVVVPLGRVSVNPISQLQPLVATQPQSHSWTGSHPSLLDLESDTDDTGTFPTL